MSERSRPLQLVSFGDLEGQERARRFTISAQPSAINLSRPNPSPNQPPPPPPPSSQGPNNTGQQSKRPSVSILAGSTSQLALGLNQSSSSRNNSTILNLDMLLFFPSSTYGGRPTVLGDIAGSRPTSRVLSPTLDSPGLLQYFGTQNPSASFANFSLKLLNRSTAGGGGEGGGGSFDRETITPPPSSGEVVHNTALSPTQPISITSSRSPNDLYGPIQDPISVDVETPKKTGGGAKKQLVSSPVGPLVPFQQYLTMQDDGKFHILLAASGSVATIKVPLIIDRLYLIFGKNKISIQLVVTKPATHFLKGLKIHQDVKIWRDEDEWTNILKDPLNSMLTTITSTSLAAKKGKSPYDRLILHNELRRWADMLVIAPLLANTLAKIANGIADNLLLLIVRSWGVAAVLKTSVKKPLIVAPAMNTNMYTHPLTSKQLQFISQPDFGIEVLKPVEKVLVCGDIGMGGMREWADIVDTIRKRVIQITSEEQPGSGRSSFSHLRRLEANEGKPEVHNRRDDDDEDDDEDEDEDDDDDEDEDDDDDDDDDEDDDDGEDDYHEDDNDDQHKHDINRERVSKKTSDDGADMIFTLANDETSTISAPKETQNII